mmetsp:Transcript_25082/g.58229  ORF Transcript_25082/g.58229 Transcript_25082/m.58229 type:complete len:91 (-) Transcript_25082:1037-1309(-)
MRNELVNSSSWCHASRLSLVYNLADIANSCTSSPPSVWLWLVCPDNCIGKTLPSQLEASGSTLDRDKRSHYWSLAKFPELCYGNGDPPGG